MSSPAPIQSAPRPAALRALVAGYVVLLPFQFEIGSSVNFAPADCLLVLALLLAAAQLKYRRDAWSPWHFGIALTFALGSFVAALRFGKLDRYELLNKDVGLLLPFLSYAAITSCAAGWEDVRHILRVFALSVVAQNVVCVGAFLAAYFFGVTTLFVRYQGLRLSGMLLDPNAYGGLLALTFVLIEAASLGPAPLLGRKALLFSRWTLSLGLLFTFSRSAWLALALALALFAVLQPRAAGRLVLQVLMVVPCVFLLLGPRRFLPIFEEMASRPKQVQGRFDLIHDALVAFSRHPFLGGGLGSFRLSEGEIAHNSAMWFLADFGILGLSVLLGFLGWFFVRAWRTYRITPPGERPIALALLLGHTAMVGFAMGIEAFYQRHWWLVFGLIGAGYSIALRRASHPAHRCQRTSGCLQTLQ
ncbi:MAG TPA: O-antigen ligase family protein [Bryobacteraceae bacterium]|jgi:O-antigen ligase|nr:O-antigen ligase family protein [Bryobacteraceae bacterium]